MTTLESTPEEKMLYNSELISLDWGKPGKEILTELSSVIEKATIHCMHRESVENVLQYGPEEGDVDFRSNLANFLSKKYGSYVNSENLFLTSGASCSLGLLLSCLFKPESLVFSEDPTYYFATGIFNDFHKVVIPVLTDDFGLVTEDLEEKLKQQLKKNCLLNPPLKALIYTTPVFNNPRGSLLPEDRCRKLVALAQKYGATVVCDDVYNLLHYNGSAAAPKRLFAYDNQSDPDYCGNVISNGSFSKYLAPGLRIGWLEAPIWAVDKLKRMEVIRSGGGLNTFTSGIVTSLLTLGTLEDHLERIKAIYKIRMGAAINLLREELPEGCAVKSTGQGGYFIWIELPEMLDADEFLTFCKEKYLVFFLTGRRTSPSKGFANCFRLSISFYSLETLLEALRRLCAAISDFQSKCDEASSPCKSLE